MNWNTDIFFRKPVRARPLPCFVEHLPVQLSYVFVRRHSKRTGLPTPCCVRPDISCSLGSRTLFCKLLNAPALTVRMKDVRADQVSDETPDHDIGWIVQAASVAGCRNSSGGPVGEQFDPRSRVLMCCDAGQRP